MPADQNFEAREWGDGRISGTPISGGGLTDLEVRIGQALAEIPTEAEIAAMRGAANGLASLDSSGKLPASQVPSSVANKTAIGLLPDPTGTDDTAALNAILASGGYVRAAAGGAYKLSAPLVVPSNTTFDLNGASFTLNSGSNSNAIRNAAVTPTATAADGSVTSGSNIVTTALGAQAVVGQTCVVTGGGANSGVPLVGIVSAATSTTITLVKLDKTTAMNAGRTTSGAAVALHTRDSNIVILGGSWHRGSNAGSGSNTHCAFFRHVDGIRFEPGAMTSQAGKYACSIADATRIHVRLRGLDRYSDGLHLQGPILGADVPLLEGHTGDDLFAITSSDWTAYCDSAGDVSAVRVGTVLVRDGGARGAIINSGPGTIVEDIAIDAIAGECAQYGLRVGDDTGQANTTGGTYGDITIGRVALRRTGSANLVYLNPGAGMSRFSCHLDAPNFAATSNGALLVAAGGGAASIAQLHVSGNLPSCSTHMVQLSTSTVTINEMEVRDSNYTTSGTNDLVYVHGTAVQNLTLRNNRCQWPGTGNVVRVDSSSSLSRFNIIGGAYRLAAKVYSGGTGQPTLTMCVDGGAHFQSVQQLAYTQTAINVVLGACSIDTMASQAIYTATGGTANVFGIPPVIVAGSLTLIGRAGSQAVRVNGASLPVDVSALTPTDGDLALNTNAGLACGAGLVVYNASAAKWKNVYTGTTT